MRADLLSCESEDEDEAALIRGRQNLDAVIAKAALGTNCNTLECPSWLFCVLFQISRSILSF